MLLTRLGSQFTPDGPLKPFIIQVVVTPADDSDGPTRSINRHPKHKTRKHGKRRHERAIAAYLSSGEDFCLCCPHFSLLNFDVFALLSLRHWSEFGESSSFQRYPTSGECPVHAISILLNRPLNLKSIVSVPEHNALRLF